MEKRKKAKLIYSGDRLFIECKYKGQTYYFMIDTGAPKSVAFQRAAEELGLYRESYSGTCPLPIYCFNSLSEEEKEMIESTGQMFTPLYFDTFDFGGASVNIELACIRFGDSVGFLDQMDNLANGRVIGILGMDFINSSDVDLIRNGAYALVADYLENNSTEVYCKTKIKEIREEEAKLAEELFKEAKLAEELFKRVEEEQEKEAKLAEELLNRVEEEQEERQKSKETMKYLENLFKEFAK